MACGQLNDNHNRIVRFRGTVKFKSEKPCIHFENGVKFNLVNS